MKRYVREIDRIHKSSANIFLEKFVYREQEVPDERNRVCQSDIVRIINLTRRANFNIFLLTHSLQKNVNYNRCEKETENVEKNSV